jgi:uncharacterized membrane protein YraQ (UPF0718 family)
MERLITTFSEIIIKMVTAVIESLMHNWIPLSLAIIIAAVIKVYANTEKLKKILLRKSNISIPASVTVGAFTPFCACGTMAIVIGMLTTTLPWGAIMAFLTSSPLMSPQGFIMLAGIISYRFAIALTIASIVIGLGSGYITHLIEKRTNFLKNQARFKEKSKIKTCACIDTVTHFGQVLPGTQVCCAGQPGANIRQPMYDLTAEKATADDISTNLFFRFFKNIKWREIARALISIGLRQILLYFMIFVAVGFLINYFVPTSFIMSLFSSDNIFAVPLAGFIGLPIYISGESSIPLIKTLITGGASEGAMLAFMITGQGTSAWVIAGIATFMKKRVLALYILFILIGGILLGYFYDLILAIGI